MKWTTLRALVVSSGTALSFALIAPASASAQATVDSVNRTATTEPVRVDDGPDYGWIGLLGLAGLAGLRRPKPVVHETVRTTTADPTMRR